MADMKLGYGSEYQLLRYLGHHRRYLDSKIKAATKRDAPIEWMDYPANPKRKSLDSEWEGIAFLEQLHYPNYNRISKAWNVFWPRTGKRLSWDGIFLQDGVIYIVEAKAHINELVNPTHAQSKSRATIRKAFEQVTRNPTKAELWSGLEYYQLANRIAFVHFLNSQGVRARLCYIFFLNGYLRDATMNVTDERVFRLAFEDECNALQLTRRERGYIAEVYIDATTDGLVL